MNLRTKPYNRTQETRNKRKENNRGEPKPKILIFCEGEKTEPNYFRSFKVLPSITVEIFGTGANTNSLVNEAIKKSQNDIYDEVWCVFDRDSFPKQNFNEAFHLAKNNNIKIAYSNESFELWYILHFEYFNSGNPRNEYIKKLNHYLSELTKSKNYKYEKSSDSMYDLLLDKQSIAIRNAKKLLKSYEVENPEKNKPSTTVHLLVERLNELLKK